jgi:hypothetical protein
LRIGLVLIISRAEAILPFRWTVYHASGPVGNGRRRLRPPSGSVWAWRVRTGGGVAGAGATTSQSLASRRDEGRMPPPLAPGRADAQRYLRGASETLTLRPGASETLTLRPRASETLTLRPRASETLTLRVTDTPRWWLRDYLTTPMSLSPIGKTVADIICPREIGNATRATVSVVPLGQEWTSETLVLRGRPQGAWGKRLRRILPGSKDSLL